MYLTRTRIALVSLALVLVAGAAAGGGKKCAAEAIHTVGGDVQKPVRTAGPIPSYPDFGREEKIEGTVVARVVIERDGTVGAADVVESLREDFDSYTVENLKQWIFEPATLNGDPVRVYYHLTVNYELDGEESPKTGAK